MNEYKTKDIFEAAWIYSQEITLLELEENGDYFWFVFKNKDTCEKLSSDYWTQKSIGNIKQFVNSLKTLKDLIFSKKNMIKIDLIRKKYKNKITKLTDKEIQIMLDYLYSLCRKTIENMATNSYP